MRGIENVSAMPGNIGEFELFKIGEYWFAYHVEAYF